MLLVLLKFNFEFFMFNLAFKFNIMHLHLDSFLGFTVILFIKVTLHSYQSLLIILLSESVFIIIVIIISRQNLN